VKISSKATLRTGLSAKRIKKRLLISEERPSQKLEVSALIEQMPESHPI
jgi:hypothetical protein